MSGNPSKSQVKVLFQAGEEGVDLNGDGVSISLNLERIQAMISSLSPLFLTQNINQAELSKGLQADQTNDSLYESYSSQIDTAFDTLISDLNKMLNKERLKLKQELASFLKKRKGVIDSLSSAFQDNTSKNAPNKGAVQFKSLWDNFLTSQEKMNGNNSNLSKIPPLVQLLEKQIQSTLTPGNVLSLRWANGEKIFRMQKYSISSAPINIPFTADLDIRGSYFSMMRVGLIDRFLLQSPLRDHDLRAESCKSRALIYSNAMSQPYYAKLFYFRKTDNLPDNPIAFEAYYPFKMQIEVDTNRFCRFFINGQLQYEYLLPHNFIPHLYAQNENENERCNLEVEILQVKRTNS